MGELCVSPLNYHSDCSLLTNVLLVLVRSTNSWKLSHSLLQLPLKLTPIHATKHHGLDDLESSSYCGTLWLRADSSDLWDAWLREGAVSHFPGPQNLVAQLCIEMATDVSPATSQAENWNRVVIGRCVKVGIELHFLSSFDAPLRILKHGLSEHTGSLYPTAKDHTFDFNVESVLLPELSVSSR